LNDCKNPNQYCYICCENEFGETHADEREKCFEKCAGLNSESSDDKSQGNWVWVPRLNKVNWYIVDVDIVVDSYNIIDIL